MFGWLFSTLTTIAALNSSKADKTFLSYQALVVDRQLAPRTAPAAVESSVAGPLASLVAVIDVCRSQGLDVEDGVGVERILRRLGQGRTARKVHNLRLARNLNAHPVGDLVAEVASLVGLLERRLRPLRLARSWGPAALSLHLR